MNRRTLLSLFALTALAATACSHHEAPANLKTLSVDEVATRIAAADGKTFVFDNNPKERFAKGHVPGARWVDFKSVSASDLPSDKNATLVFYCANELWHACHTAAVAAEKLGYTNVYVMPAGIRGWEKAGKPVEQS